jgi:glycosyltransferase involved in cell wall biosynthesis
MMLALVGTGVSKDKVAEAKAKYPSTIVAPGQIAHKDIADWMAACDVFVLPSWAEGSPNVVLEALASGRPPVGTRVGGIPEIIDDGKNGILTRPKDARGLALSILSTLARKWDPKALRASAPISWAESAAMLRAVLEGAIESHRTRPKTAPITTT